jgi:hypothetical protein
VAQGPKNTLFYYSATPGSAWSSEPVALAGTAYSAPAIALRANGEADVVAQGPNNTLVYYWATPGSAWSSATIAGIGTTYSAPAIALRCTSGTFPCTAFLVASVVAQGPGNTLWHYSATPGSSWSSTMIAGTGTTYSAPAIAVRSRYEEDVVVQGPGNELWYYYMDPNTGIWGGRFSAQITVSAPAMVIRSSGETDIVGSGPNNALYYFWPDPTSFGGFQRAVLGVPQLTATLQSNQLGYDISYSGMNFPNGAGVNIYMIGLTDTAGALLESPAIPDLINGDFAGGFRFNCTNSAPSPNASLQARNPRTNQVIASSAPFYLHCSP